MRLIVMALLGASTWLGANPPGMAQLLALQREMAGSLEGTWNATSDLFQVKDGPFGAQFYEKPNIFGSPLMAATLLWSSNRLLHQTKMTDDQKFAAWLASTQVMMGLRNALITLNKGIPKTQSRVQDAGYYHATEQLFYRYAANLAFTAPLLNPEHAQSERWKDDFAEIQEMYSKANPKMSYTVFLALTDQGGSLTWQEPHLDDWDRMVELVQGTTDPDVRYLTAAKLALVAKFQFNNGNGARDKLRAKLNKVFADLGSNAQHSWALRALVVSSLATTLMGKGNKDPGFAKMLEPGKPENFAKIEDRLGYHLLKEASAMANDYRTGQGVASNMADAILKLEALFPDICNSDLGKLKKKMIDEN